MAYLCISLYALCVRIHTRYIIYYLNRERDTVMYKSIIAFSFMYEMYDEYMLRITLHFYMLKYNERETERDIIARKKNR